MVQHVGGGIGWTFINTLRLQVARECGILRVQEINFVGECRKKIVIVAEHPEYLSLPTPRLLRAVGHEHVIVIRAVKHPGYRQLPLIAQTLDPMRLLPGLRQCGEQEPGEDRDDGDHNQKLDQRKALRCLLPSERAHSLKNLYTICPQTAPLMWRRFPRVPLPCSRGGANSAANSTFGLPLRAWVPGRADW